MPWFDFSNSDKRFYVDEADAPAVSVHKWRIEWGVPFTRGQKSYPIERILGWPPLKSPGTRAFKDGNPLNYSRGNYFVLRRSVEEQFRESPDGNVDRRIGLGPTIHNPHFVGNPRLRHNDWA